VLFSSPKGNSVNSKNIKKNSLESLEWLNFPKGLFGDEIFIFAGLFLLEL